MILRSRFVALRAFAFAPLAAGMALSLAQAADEAPAIPDTGIKALTAAKTPLKKDMKISIFGDSITMQGGYADDIQKALGAAASTKDLNIQITRHGLNGGRVPTVLEGKSEWGDLGGTFEALLEKDKPDILVIFLGVNDVWHREKGTSPAEYRSGLKKMIDLGTAAKAKIVLVTPMCIGERPDGKGEFDKELDKYAGIVRTLAKESRAGLADVRTATIQYLKKANPKTDGEYKANGILTGDGVHLNAQGNALVADVLAQAIVDALK
jgi:lysophospholipase L1-like esterase